jgi:hypothetical protein
MLLQQAAVLPAPVLISADLPHKRVVFKTFDSRHLPTEAKVSSKIPASQMTTTNPASTTAVLEHLYYSTVHHTCHAVLVLVNN